MTQAMSTGHQVSFETVRFQMMDQILTNYSVPEWDRKDPISWSTSPGAKEQFEVKHLGRKLVDSQRTSFNVLHYEQLSYPQNARLQRVEGLVTVRIELDSDGSVKLATARSGPKALAEQCDKNALKWRFDPTGPKQGLLVYRFFLRETCESPCSSSFEFHPPNLSIITTGRVAATP